MAKRFIDTELDDQPWFCELSCRMKCAVQYLFRKCDHAGIWQPNYKIAEAYIGEGGFTEQELLAIDQGRQFMKLPNGKIFLPGFIKFQYGKLSKDCKPHVPIYRSLERNGIDIETVQMSLDMGKTHNVTDRQKELVLKQDKYICCYCGKEKELWNLVIDHVVSRKRGGTDSIQNLVASCVPCNSKKSDYSLEEFCAKYSLDYSTIIKRVSERLSQRVSNTLQEKEKDKEKEKEEDFGKSKNLSFNPHGIVPDMAKQFIEANPGYYFNQSVDFPIILEIGQKIFQGENLTGQLFDVENKEKVKRRWGEIIPFIRAHSHFGGYSLAQINKHFPGIIQSFNNEHKKGSTGGAHLKVSPTGHSGL